MLRLSGSGSKTIDRKVADRLQASHLERLNKIKRSSSQTFQLQNNHSDLIKNASYLRNNDKKKELKKELQNIQVDRDNRILLSKITKIVNNSVLRNTFYNFQSIQQINEAKSKSMNQHLRKQEIEKVAAENPAIAQRISQQSSFYDVKKWEKDFKSRETYIKNLCEFSHVQTSKHSPERNSLKALQEIDSPARKILHGKKMQSPNLLHRRSLSTDLSSAKTLSDPKINRVSKKLVLYKKEHEINNFQYLVDFSMVERKFKISAKDLSGPNLIKYVILEEEVGKQLLIENNNNYDKIISKIYFQGEKIYIKGFYEEKEIKSEAKIELFDSLSYPSSVSIKKEMENHNQSN